MLVNSWPIRLVGVALLLAALWIAGYCFWLTGDGPVSKMAQNRNEAEVLVGVGTEPGMTPPGLKRPHHDREISRGRLMRQGGRAQDPNDDAIYDELVMLMRYAIGMDRELAPDWKAHLSLRQVSRYYGGVCRTARSRISLGLINYVLGTPLYHSGPHENGWNQWDQHDFGRYNPSAIRKIQTGFRAFNRDSVARGAGAMYYRLEAMENIRSKWHARQLMLHNPTFAQELVDAHIKKVQESRGFSIWNQLTPQHHAMVSCLAGELPGVSQYQIVRSMGFWTRRTIDGSADAFDQAITELLEAYDPETLSSHDVPYVFADIQEHMVTKRHYLPHFVAHSDSVAKIAQLYGSKVEWIEEENPEIPDFSNLRPGTRLNVPIYQLE